jgi:hypothetical protein
MSSYPAVWSKLNDGERGSVFLFPIPSISSEWEWDTACTPIPLVDDSTVEAIPDPFTDAVKYYAAGLAFLRSQRYGIAEKMFEMFLDHCGVNRAAVEQGAVPDYYYADDSW